MNNLLLRLFRVAPVVTLLVALLAVAQWPTTALADEELERWDRVVCLVTETPQDGKPGFTWGSGFFVAYEGELYLVTARHVAEKTTAKSRILYRKTDGESRWLVLGACLEKQGDPWHNHGTADLSWLIVAEDSKVSPAEREWLFDLAIDWSSLAEEMPKRTTAVEITGYPMGLGTAPEVTPLVMSGSIASRELRAESKWGIESVFYAVPAVAGGVSGGPVFQTIDDAAEVQVVGMYIAVGFDDSGGKLSKCIPAHLIRAALAGGKETANCCRSAN